MTRHASEHTTTRQSCTRVTQGSLSSTQDGRRNDGKRMRRSGDHAASLFRAPAFCHSSLLALGGLLHLLVFPHALRIAFRVHGLLAKLLEQKDSLGARDEHFGAAKAPLGLRDIAAVLLRDELGELAHTVHTAALQLAVVEHVKALEEDVVGGAVGVTGLLDLDVLHKAEVLHLVQHTRGLDVHWALLLVGLDAADVVWRAAHERVDE
mmetsp:Transcript_12658/g.40449  ORF Transcript_12658/g.40449 Transcript_12658/m.40449 type:complete len:208 (-) Transcript_12658:953-1576(-)